MSQSWDEEWRQRTRRRRLRIGLVVVLGALVAIPATRPSPFRSDPPLEAAPGYAAKERTLDTTPFRLPKPDQQGSTTLLFPEDLGPTDPYAATTTTLPAVTITLPPEASFPPGDAACATINELYQLARSSQFYQSEGVFADEAAKHLERAVSELESANDPTYRSALLLAQETLTQMQAATSQSDAARILMSLTQPATAAAREAVSPLLDHASTACPGLLSSD